MTILKIEIDEDRDLPELQTLLTKMGLKYEIEEDEDDWGDLPDEAIESIKAGLADAEAGRVHSHEEVMARINEKLNRMGIKNG